MKHIPRVLVDTPLAVDTTCLLPREKAHHIATVLRLGINDTLHVFNGDGHEYTATIINSERSKVSIKITGEVENQAESPLKIILLQGIARNDRMDFALAKAVELGVYAIQPVFTQRSKVKLKGARLEKKQIHWQAVVDSAVEQSGRVIRPTVQPAAPLQACLTALKSPTSLICDPYTQRRLHDLPKTDQITLLIGPESGLTEAEVTIAQQAGYQSICLGGRVLRTETAGMAAIAALQTLWGDF